MNTEVQVTISDGGNWKDLLTFAEASRESGISADTLSSRVRSGSMKSYHRQGRVYITLEDVGEWSPLWYRGHEAVIREAHAAGEPDAYTATLLGLTRERVRQLRKKLGLPANPPKPRLAKAFAPRNL
jgi:hypothetical protein